MLLIFRNVCLFSSAAHRNYWMCCDEANMTKSNKLRGFIEDYFENDKSVEMRINEAEEEANRLEVISGLGLIKIQVKIGF